MLGIFDSKNKKLVKRWRKEHEELVVLGQKVIGEYVKNNIKNAKKNLKNFVDLAVDHLSSEDIELYKMLSDPKRRDDNTERLADEFQRSFKDTKTTLMKFLAKYVRPETELDEEFFDTFNQIMEILGKRIKFEEENLYFQMSLS